jgi:amidase
LGEETRWLDATAQAQLVARGEVSPVELVEAAAARIEALDGPLNAVCLRWFDDAVAAARSPELPDGPLRGVPFLLKDLWAAFAGQPLTNGNRAMHRAGYRSPANTWLVDRFVASGLVTMGRGASPEWGSVPVTEPELFGPTRNPWDVSRSAGGSSGGSAAAVAAGMVPIAHASDGGGSIRVPASCCGVVGLKPSQGRITVGPARDESNLGVELCVSRTVRDTALMLDIAQGPGVGDTVIAAPPTRPYVDEVGADPGRLRIGFLDHSPRGLAIPDECRDAVRTTAGLLASLGHRVEDSQPEAMFDETFTRNFSTMWAANMAVNARRAAEMIGRDLTDDEIEPINQGLIGLAGKASGTDYALALAGMSSFRRRMQSWWTVDGWDLLLTPTLGDLPVPVGTFANDRENPLRPFGRSAGFVPFTPMFNGSYQPAISVPVCWTDAGLPIGIQLVAAYGREDLLIRVAAQLEAAAPWAHRRPAVG